MREKAGRVAGDAPEASFADIKEKMMAAAASRRKPGWLRYAAAAAVAAVVAGAGLLLFTNRSGDYASNAGEMVAEAATTSNDRSQPQTEDSVIGNTVTDVPQSQSSSSKKATSVRPASISKDALAETHEPEARPATAADNNTDNTSHTEAKTGSANDNAGTNTADTNYTDKNNNQKPAPADPFAEPVEPLHKQIRKFSVSASGLLAGNTSKSGGADEAVNRGMVTYTDSRGNLYYSMGAPEVKYNYSAPVSAGISLRYSFTDRFFAETGVRFTYLHTWITPSQANQDLLYAGIPVGVGYNFANNNDFQFYGSVYGMGAKCIMGRESVNFPSNFAKMGDIPVMWSTGASLGASYNITRHIGLFAEPTVSYYIPDKDAPQTLYKENPFYFTLNLGVRFNFQ